jgi:hypothetical protein
MTSLVLSSHGSGSKSLNHDISGHGGDGLLLDQMLSQTEARYEIARPADREMTVVLV